MLSVLPTSWQQQHGPGRRRRCGNGAARVAEPAFAPARRPREPPPALPWAPRPSPGAGAADGGRRPAREAPPPPPRGDAAPRDRRRGARAGARRSADASGARAEERPGPPRGATGAAADEQRRERGSLAGARAQIISNTRCLTVVLATLAIVFHCLRKIKIAPEIGEFDLKERP